MTRTILRTIRHKEGRNQKTLLRSDGVYSSYVDVAGAQKVDSAHKRRK